MLYIFSFTQFFPNVKWNDFFGLSELSVGRLGKKKYIKNKNKTFNVLYPVVNAQEYHKMLPYDALHDR